MSTTTWSNHWADMCTASVSARADAESTSPCTVTMPALAVGIALTVTCGFGAGEVGRAEVSSYAHSVVMSVPTSFSSAVFPIETDIST
jgi:hypothetical protein